MPQSLLDKAMDLISENRAREAGTEVIKYLNAAGDIPRALSLLGISSFSVKNYESALAFMNAAIRLSPKRADYHHNVGAMYRVFGDFDKAEQAYMRAIELKPDYTEAYFNLSAVRKFNEQDEILGRLESLLSREDWSGEDACFLHFAAGKMFDDAGQYDRAWENYLLANANRGLSFDMERNLRVLDETRQSFSAETMDRLAGSGSGSHQPVFVVGMPRSGTTLVEQILAAHPNVQGAGELRDIGAITRQMRDHHPEHVEYPAAIRTIEPIVILGFANGYLQRLAQMGMTAERVANKMPYDFRSLGLIELMFPNSSIVHCRRPELDVCLSCFFQRFRSGNEWAYDIDSIAQYYVGYERLMEHWKTVMPGRIFDLDYLELLDDQEGVTRRLLQYCGLDWNEACLDFHNLDRPVTTASNWQVRRPLNRGSVDRWKKYEAHLGPLQESLARARERQGG